MFEQTFKNIDDILHKDAGCSSELDYVEQPSWVLFLKYLEDYEKGKKTSAELAGRQYAPIYIKLQKTFADTENSWAVDVDSIDSDSYDLSVKNPNKKEESVFRSPSEILDAMNALDEESAKILEKIRGLL